MSTGTSGAGHADPVADAVFSLLAAAPERWQPIDRDSLTAAEDRAFGLLVGAGLVEVRYAARATGVADGPAADVTVRLTGTVIDHAAADRYVGQLWAVFGDSFARWRADNPGVPPPCRFQVEWCHWRVTDQGVTARADVESGDGYRRHTVAEWVLRPAGSYFAFQPPAGGVLVLERIERVGPPPAPPGPTPVAVTNPAELADAIRHALADLIVGGNKPAPEPTPRIVLDPARRAVSLDGKEIAADVPEDAYHFFRLLAENPRGMSWKTMTDAHPFGDTNYERVKNDMPPALERLIERRQGRPPRLKLP